MKAKNKYDFKKELKKLNFKEPKSGMIIMILVILFALILTILAKILLWIGIFAGGGYAIWYLINLKKEKNVTK